MVITCKDNVPVPQLHIKSVAGPQIASITEIISNRFKKMIRVD